MHRRHCCPRHVWQIELCAENYGCLWTFVQELNVQAPKVKKAKLPGTKGSPPKTVRQGARQSRRNGKTNELPAIALESSDETAATTKEAAASDEAPAAVATPEEAAASDEARAAAAEEAAM